MCTHAGKGGGTISTLTQPGGELLLGLPTLLTMHRVNAEVKRTQNNPITSYYEPKRSKQPYFNATATHEQTLSFLTCEERAKMNWGTGKAAQRVNASIRHMHREHSAYSNPTCALRAPFASHTFHSCFNLCWAKEMSARTPNEHSVDNPNEAVVGCPGFWLLIAEIL